ncbi:hypothetical protein [Erythrobacter sp. BLCC-B19]|uniref:hypothetical protein n=1 Tax=Erythrobacter sp. BLCC-B19 TaxID=3025315 RepID=UPI00235F8B75|nr:hypothetical protein [Erythrobacter sp. BLCC-B19]WDA40919.1 hypothetical protein PS060_15380 [Erythrobacter sp. BLCC-B19]
MFKNIVGKLLGRKQPEPESRIAYLLGLYHQWVEGKEQAWDGLDKAGLIERQIAEGDAPMATMNLAGHVRNYVELAKLYWGQGDIAQARHYLGKAVDRHERMVDYCAVRGPVWPNEYSDESDVRIAAYLLGRPLTRVPRHPREEPDRYPSFKAILLDAIADDAPLDMARWQDWEDSTVRNRWPKFQVAEAQFYRRALIGEFASGAALLAAHEALWKSKAGKTFERGWFDGYDDNDLIIDTLFAAVLKRIGWEGRYRHSWPETLPYLSVPETAREPDRFITLAAAPLPAPSGETGIIADPQAARRFLDHHLASQTDDEGQPFSAARPAKEAGKVAAALKALGWVRDPAALDLMRAYRMDHVLTRRSHLSLCDPVARAVTLKGWNDAMRQDFGLHPDLIAIAESEERADYADPQGLWYVLWVKDRKVYAADREQWHDPKLATADARPGLTMWPNYVSFVAWWVSGD